MLRRKKTKTAALLLSLIILMFFNISPCDVGLFEGCDFHNRMTYHFFHANILHLVLNLWCFLSCVFLTDMPPSKILIAYIIAVTVPTTTSTPTIGLSGVCFAMLGFIMWQARNKVSYNISVLSCLILPIILLPRSVNNFLHAYCYIISVIIGFCAKHCH